jgi:UDP-GlcNAc:undecaprenyl-phosphate GlcNAc-1-phosphate transferase
MTYRPELWEILIAGLVSGLLTGLLIPLAPRLGLVDAPSPRKVHDRPTPRGGGIAIYLGVVVGVIVHRPADLLDNTGLILLGIGGAIAVVGLIDDRRPLPWQLRILVHLSAAASAVYLLFEPAPWWLFLVGVLWIVGLTNAFNMLDNMDMLSAGTAFVAAAVLAVVYADFPQANARTWQGYCWLMFAALAGFLWFNRPPARIFMGDVGSTFLGFFLGVTALNAASPPAASMDWLVPVFLLAVPLYDMTSVVLIRLRQGRSPFHADKQHLSHRLAAMGLSRPGAVAVIHVLALVSGGFAVLLAWTNETVERWVIAASFLIGWIAFMTFDVAMFQRRQREETT